MATKLNLTSQKILDELFPAVPRGYDPLIVDQFLDKIIQDYLVIESNELIEKKEIDDLRAELARIKDENYKLVVENGKYKMRFEGIKDNTNVTRENMDYIRKIDKMEKWFYNHGINPDDI